MGRVLSSRKSCRISSGMERHFMLQNCTPGKQSPPAVIGRGCVKTQPKNLSKIFALVYRAIGAFYMLGRDFSTPFSCVSTSCSVFTQPPPVFVLLPLQTSTSEMYSRHITKPQCSNVDAPQHFLNFFPLPHGHGSLRPTLGCSR